MARHPVIEKLVTGAIERCRERVTAAREGGAGARKEQQFGEEAGFTNHMKRSHGL